MREYDLRHSKAFSLFYNQFKDSLTSASEVKIFRIICDTEEKDGRNCIFEFLQRKETQNKEQIVIKNQIPGWPDHTSFG